MYVHEYTVTSFQTNLTLCEVTLHEENVIRNLLINNPTWFTDYLLNDQMKHFSTHGDKVIFEIKVGEVGVTVPRSDYYILEFDSEQRLKTKVVAFF